MTAFLWETKSKSSKASRILLYRGEASGEYISGPTPSPPKEGPLERGQDKFLALVKESQFTWVTANLLDARAGETFGAEPGVQPFTVLTVNSIKVGFTNLATAEFKTSSFPGPNLQSVVAVLHSLICVNEAESPVSQVDGIDAIVGNHCATTLDQSKQVGQTIISRLGDEFANWRDASY